MKFPILKDGFCCHLPTAGILIGWFGIIVGLILIPTSIFAIIRTHATFNAAIDEIDHPDFVELFLEVKKKQLIINSVVLAAGFIFVISSASLIYGILKHLEKLLIPSIVWTSLLLLIQIILFGHNIFMLINYTITLVNITLIAMSSYALLCILSLFEYFKKNPVSENVGNKKLEKTLDNVENDVEFLLQE